MYTNRFRLVIIVLVILVVVLSLLLLIKNEESSSATVYYIVNNSKTDSAFYESQSESIATSAVGSSSQKTIASMSGVKQLARTNNSLYAITMNNDKKPSLQKVDMSAQRITTIDTVQADTLLALRASFRGDQVGVVARYEDGRSVLYVADALLGEFRVAAGVPERVVEWCFSPDGSVIAASLYDGSVVLVDVASGKLTALGQVGSLGGFFADGGSLLLHNKSRGFVRFSIADRASEALPTFAKTYNSIARPMHTNGNVLIVVRPLDQSKGAQLILVKPGGENQTIHTLDPGVMVSDVVVSPDDSRVAVETLSDSVQHILILDMTRPQVLLRLDGRDPVWQVSTPALK